jgi:hypothetical protein
LLPAPEIVEDHGHVGLLVAPTARPTDQTFVQLIRGHPSAAKSNSRTITYDVETISLLELCDTADDFANESAPPSRPYNDRLTSQPWGLQIGRSAMTMVIDKPAATRASIREQTKSNQVQFDDVLLAYGKRRALVRIAAAQDTPTIRTVSTALGHKFVNGSAQQLQLVSELMLHPTTEAGTPDAKVVDTLKADLETRATLAVFELLVAAYMPQLLKGTACMATAIGRSPVAIDGTPCPDSGHTVYAWDDRSLLELISSPTGRVIIEARHHKSRAMNTKLEQLLSQTRTKPTLSTLVPTITLVSGNPRILMRVPEPVPSTSS